MCIKKKARRHLSKDTDSKQRWTLKTKAESYGRGSQFWAHVASFWVLGKRVWRPSPRRALPLPAPRGRPFWPRSSARAGSVLLRPGLTAAGSYFQININVCVHTHTQQDTRNRVRRRKGKVNNSGSTTESASLSQEISVSFRSVTVYGFCLRFFKCKKG